MEQELLKLAARVSVLGVVVWVIAAAFGKVKHVRHNHAQSDPTQTQQNSNVWRVEPVSGGPAAQPFSGQPGSTLVG